ncbi:MAG TPA: chemotaxis protein CheB, partial [Nitrospiria bacterium]|nr:chemotaxis protein CheB [Nitrospiria bacterium]
MKKTVKKTRTRTKPPVSEPSKSRVSSSKVAKTVVKKSEENDFCVAGIGASAGGLEALEEFFRHTPIDTGLAFVVVQHLDPSHKSIMVELLQRCTKMQVHQVEDGMLIRPNFVYVIPPNKQLAVLHGKLHLIDLDPLRPIRLPIDFFLCSLADEKGNKAICIILSGTGTDGALGLRAVKVAGGMTMVQEESTAKFDSMPRNAIATGSVDRILPAAKMPSELIKYACHPYTRMAMEEMEEPKNTGDMDKIFILLRTHTGHDFSNYKRTTTGRRIERRMAVHQINDIKQYLHYMQQNKTEIDALFKELLIGVTSFFRDREAFEVLEKKVIPRLFENKTPDIPIRVWVAGCSTGEEAYSIAILLREAMEKLPKTFKAQVFATDIDQQALEVARHAYYPESIATNIPPAHLNFFSKEGTNYRVKQAVREMMLFTKHDLLRDPPFSKLDLVVCRNLLIYLSPALQKKVLPLFHYTLNPKGFMMLGPSETIAEFVDLFELVDKKWKVFRRKQLIGHVAELPMAPLARMGIDQRKRSPKVSTDLNTIQRIEKILLEEYTLPCAVITEKNEILYIRGRTDRYLEPAVGEASMNILKMAREGLRIPLRTALQKALRDRTTVFYPKVRVQGNRMHYTVNLMIKPFDKKSMPGLVLVVFEDVTSLSPPGIKREKTKRVFRADQRAVELEQELNSAKATLQTMVDELELTNEELKSSNEELQSTNEELQSTNEEQETSKEELQSVNEELTTVNSELQSKMDELSQNNSDVVNLLKGTEIATFFLDNQLQIKRFTPTVARLFNLIPGDIGRPISHIAPNLVGQDIALDAKEVLKTLVSKEREVRTKTGSWFLMRIMPYRTLANVIDGVVATFVDITDLKKQKLAAEAALRYAEAVIATIREPLIVLDGNLRVVSANPAYRRTFEVKKEETEGVLIYDLGDGQWNIPKLKSLLEEILPQNTSIENFEVEHTFKGIGHKKMSLNARKIVTPEEETQLILLAIRDITLEGKR